MSRRGKLCVRRPSRLASASWAALPLHRHAEHPHGRRQATREPLATLWEGIVSLPPLAAVDTGERSSPDPAYETSQRLLAVGGERRSSSWLGPAPGLRVPFAVLVTVETSETLD